MYLKILSRDDENIYVYDDIETLHHQRWTVNNDGFEELMDESDQSILYATPSEGDGDDEQLFCSQFTVTHRSGRERTILYDGVAYYCNEQGKAVERFVAN